MKKIVYVTIVLAVLLIFLISVENEKIPTTRMCFDDICFDVWIANTDAKKESGLMNVKFLNSNQGMLFVFATEENYTFWMKDTLIPLDMVWINSELEVVDIISAVPCTSDPCKLYYPNQNAMYVLEIAPGSNVKIGDTLTIYF